jgi:hypothetical protein
MTELKRRRIGRTKLEVTELGLGGAPMGGVREVARWLWWPGAADQEPPLKHPLGPPLYEQSHLVECSPTGSGTFA